ncbi:hypothetical protein [Streptococcus equinus]|uniref:hypothetical protein n=1 Tax=Streptococcus equinus TaxID=1335 RepID=UPI0015F35B72|nr:hypothetical protein [Streptococcus equinus]QMS96925.1 hypothetical protein H1R75_03370 [Streptococcus equinus]
MKVKFLLKDGELTSNISRQTYDIILACWHNNEKFRIGNGKIDGKDILGIEVLEDGNEDV